MLIDTLPEIIQVYFETECTVMISSPIGASILSPFNVRRVVLNPQDIRRSAAAGAAGESGIY